MTQPIEPLQEGYRTAPRNEMALGLGTLMVGIGLAVGAVSIQSDAGYGGVGPNFLPWLIAVVLMVCGVLLIWESRSGGLRNMDEPSGAATGHWAGFAWVSVGILANALLINKLGFILSCTLCFVLAVRGFKAASGQPERGVRSWLRDTLIGICIAGPVYWLFTKLLAINLPGLTRTGWL
jgi:putative tricarboxylic transport membrane protein